MCPTDLWWEAWRSGLGVGIVIMIVAVFLVALGFAIGAENRR